MNEAQRIRLRKQLQRLGRRKRDPRPPSPPSSPARPETLLEGDVLETPRGTLLRVEHCFPLDHTHGRYPLGRVLEAPRTPLRDLVRPSSAAPPHVDRLLFLDTETTGLAGGTGTVPFLVGLGVLQEDRVCVRQYFLRDLHEEEAMLHVLTEEFVTREGVVTYNGRAFDLPLLETRFLLHRMNSPLTSLVDLDLLVAVRRLWRLRLARCGLGDVEQHILGHRRGQQDIPGWLVPTLYRQYLRTRDPRPLTGVFYHNLHDVLSMIGLVDVILRVWADPWSEPVMEPEDFVAWARWLLRQGREEDAKVALRHATSAPIRAQAYELLGRVLKRQGRWHEAVKVWLRWIEEYPYAHILPYEELAKYYEWVAKDVEEALAWVRRGREALDHMEVVRQFRAREALDYREARLRRKLGISAS